MGTDFVNTFVAGRSGQSDDSEGKQLRKLSKTHLDNSELKLCRIVEMLVLHIFLRGYIAESIGQSRMRSGTVRNVRK